MNIPNWKKKQKPHRDCHSCVTQLTMRHFSLFLPRFPPPVSPPQGIVPQAASTAVRELFVPAGRIAAAKAEAETLPVVDINKVRLFPLLMSRDIHPMSFALSQSQRACCHYRRHPTLRSCLCPRRGRPTPSGRLRPYLWLTLPRFVRRLRLHGSRACVRCKEYGLNGGILT